MYSKWKNSLFRETKDIYYPVSPRGYMEISTQRNHFAKRSHDNNCQLIFCLVLQKVEMSKNSN